MKAPERNEAGAVQKLSRLIVQILEGSRVAARVAAARQRSVSLLFYRN